MQEEKSLCSFVKLTCIIQRDTKTQHLRAKLCLTQACLNRILTTVDYCMKLIQLTTNKQHINPKQ